MGSFSLNETIAITPGNQRLNGVNIHQNTGGDMDQEWREWRETVNDQLEAGGKRMGAMEASLKTLGDSTQELVDMLHSVKGAFKVLDVVGMIAKPLLSITALCAAVYVLFKTGAWPE